MFQAIRPAIPVLLAIALIEAGIGILNPLISLQLEYKGVSSFLVGFTSSAYSIGFLAGSWTGHKIIDRVGHIRALCVFAVMMADSILLHIIFGHPFVWLLLRVVQGYASAGAYLVIESWLNDKAKPEVRGRIFGIYTAISWGTSGLSPLLFNVTDHKGPILFVIATIFMAASLMPMALTKVANPEVAHRQHTGILKLIRISPLAVSCCFGAGFLDGALFALLPVYTANVGLNVSQLSILISMSTWAAIGQFPIGHWADKQGRRPVIISTMLCAMVFALTLYFLTSASFPIILILFFLMMLFQSPIYALGVGQMTDYVEKKDFVSASSGLLFAWGIGAAMGPSTFGLIMDYFGGRSLFLVLSIGFASIASFGLYRMMRRRAKEPRQQSHFVAQPVSLSQGTGTAGAPELDPRREE